MVQPLLDAISIVIRSLTPLRQGYAGQAGRGSLVCSL